MAGVAPAGNAWAVAGTLAVVLASVFYASAGIYGQLRLEPNDLRPRARDGLDARGRPASCCRSPPPGRRRRCPLRARSGRCCCSSLVGTALAQLILFRVDRALRRPALQPRHVPDAGLRARVRGTDPRRAGRAAALVGLALILLGVALGSGRAAISAAPPSRHGAEAVRLGVPSTARAASDEDAERRLAAGSRGGRARSPRGGRRCGRAPARRPRRCRSRRRSAARSASSEPARRDRERVSSSASASRASMVGSTLMLLSSSRTSDAILLLDVPGGGIRRRLRMSQLERVAARSGTTRSTS